MKYKIWDKKEMILTPIGEVLTAEQWIERYPIAGVDNIKIVCADEEINGSFFGTLGQMVSIYASMGADFSLCETDEDKLRVIEAFEEEQNKPKENVVSNEELTATSLASIAASLEYQNMLTLTDVEEV